MHGGTWIAGVGGSNHDFSACLVRDGRPVIAVEEERLQRLKHADTRWHAQPTLLALAYCLQAVGLELRDVDTLVVNSDLEAFDPSTHGATVTCTHHALHAAASFFTAPVEQAALLVVDGCGGPLGQAGSLQRLETVSLGQAAHDQFDIKVLQSGHKHISSTNWTYRVENSLGTFYELVTEALGFGEFGEGTTMGLAAYGDDALVDDLCQFVRTDSECGITFDPYGGIHEWLQAALNSAGNAFMVRAQIARATQVVFERAMIHLATLAYDRTRREYLCIGGGCGLNCAANGMLAENTPFEEVFVFPAAGDSGLSIGGALYGSFLRSKRRQWIPTRQEWSSIAFLGREYSLSDCRSALAESSVFSRLTGPSLSHTLARRLAEGEIIAVARGRSEFGPRALGHRSILASPYRAATRDYLNLHVKNRESFRPFAPIVPLDVASEYFAVQGESPFMLAARPAREEYRATLQAVVAADGTARLQTVREEADPFMYHLLQRFGDITGHPVLLNTSFNRRGEPIVESPVDAIRTFLALPINTLVLNDFLVEKHTPWAARTFWGGLA